MDLPKTAARPARRAFPVPPNPFFREKLCLFVVLKMILLSMILPSNENQLHLLHAKPVGYSSKDFSYYKGTPPDGFNKKTAYPSRHTDHLKMLGP